MDSVSEIKYRALVAVTNEWVYGYYVVLDSGLERVECIWELGAERATPIDRSTLGQFTGLTDKNGKEIYERDIVRLRSYLQEDIPDVIGRIRFERGSFHIYVDEFEKYNLDSLFMEIKVIGNIYQDNHLLKENED